LWLTAIQAADVIVKRDANALAPRERLPIQLARDLELRLDGRPLGKELLVDDARLGVIAVELASEAPITECAEGYVCPARAERQVNPVAAGRFRRLERQSALTHRLDEASEEVQLQLRCVAHETSCLT
jgi:hypothetical protein